MIPANMLINFTSRERLSGLHYLSQVVYAYFHSILLSVVSCKSWQKSLIAKKDTIRGFKVIRFVTDQKGIGDLLLLVNSNVGRISHGFGDTATCWSKSRPCDIHRISFNALAGGNSVRICWWTLYCHESMSREHRPTRTVILFDTIQACDGQTDG